MREDPLVPSRWEARLVARLRAGDDHALAELYEHHAGHVYALARRIVAAPALAEEITQEVFVHLWCHADRVDLAVGSVRAYLGVLTHRRAVDVVRHEHARRAREVRDQRRAPLAVADLTEVSGALADARLVRAALDELPAAQRQVIELVYLEGRAYTDAARHLGIPEGTAKSRGRLGMRKLAARLDDRATGPAA